MDWLCTTKTENNCDRYFKPGMKRLLYKKQILEKVYG